MNIHVLEMPLDFGGNRHGSDMGPSAIRLAGLKERLSQLSDSAITYSTPMDIHPSEYEEAGDPKAKYLKAITKACCALAGETEVIIRSGGFPLILGGDHSIALGSLAGIAAAHRTDGKRIGVLYVDAHGDFNTIETSPTGNIHGMCMDKEERILMKQAGVTAFTMSDIDRIGFPAILKQVTTFFRSHADVIHVSFDMDVIDPMFAPGVGIPLPGGLNYREALLLMEEISQTGMVGSAEFVEVNPVLDVRSQTARMAVELAARLLGDRIY